MDVTLPDGSVINDVPEGTTKAQLAEKLKANGRDVPAEWLAPIEQPTTSQKIKRQLGLTARAAIEGISGVPNMVLDAAQLHGSEKLSRNLTALGFPEPANATERIVQAGAQGIAGGGGMAKLSQLASEAASSPFVSNLFRTMGQRPAAQSVAGGVASGTAQTAGELGAPPAAQTLAGLATMYRPGGTGLKMPAPESIRSPLNAGRLETFRQANEAGYKFPPSAIERGVVREELESAGGKAALNQETSLHNQQTTNKLARQGAGLKRDQIIDEPNLAQARYEIAQPYREVADKSKVAAYALEEWKDANARAKLHWRDYERNLTAEAYDKYEHHYNLAKQAEDVMIQEAADDPALVQRLREARVKIAQNYDVDKALNVGTKDVRANVLGNLINKRGEQGMTGPLGVIARTQQAFPNFMTETAKTGTPGVSKLSFLASGILGLEGYHSLGLKGAAIGAAIPQISRGARALAMSDIMQRPRSAGQGIPMSALTDYLAREQAQQRGNP